MIAFHCFQQLVFVSRLCGSQGICECFNSKFVVLFALKNEMNIRTYFIELYENYIIIQNFFSLITPQKYVMRKTFHIEMPCLLPDGITP